MKILAQSDSPRYVTGFSKVVRHLYHYFSHIGHKVYAVGWQSNNAPIPECAKCDYDLVMFKKYIDRCPGYLLLPAGPHSPTGFGVHSFFGYKRSFRPDCVWTLGDVHFVGYVKDQKEDTPWVAYFPIDGDHWNEDWNAILDKCEFPVTYSKFAQKVCKKNGYDVDMVYHGHAPNVYQPFDQGLVRESKKVNLEKLGFKEDTFIVGTVQTVNIRKNWESWLYAFSEFSKDKPDVVAVLVTDPECPMAWNARIDLKRTIKVLGIKDKVWMPSTYHYWGSFNDVQIAEILNWLRDGCYFSVSGGEGFGLPLLEAMCCKVPVVALDYTTPGEFLANGRGYLVKKGDWVKSGDFDRPLPDIEDAVAKLDHLYYNREKAKKTAVKGYMWASKITWKSVIGQWTKIFNEVRECQN